MKTEYANETLWAKRALLLIMGLFLIRLAFIAFSPLELSPDEAYYWDWSRRLSWGYYSKPPMVAWIIHLSSWLFGPTEAGVRLPAGLLGTFTLFALFLLAQRMAGAKAGFWGIAIYSATIGTALSCYIMTIDAPLLCFWAFSIYLFWLAVELELEGCSGDGKMPRSWLKQMAAWIGAGLFCGLGLLSKQTMIGFTIGSLLFLLIFKETRRLWLRPGPWVFLILQFGLLLPVIYWNQHHHWITLTHTAHHFEQGGHGLHLKLKTFLDLLGTQAGIVTPVIFFLVVFSSFCVLFALIRQLRAGLQRERETLPSHWLGAGYLEILGLLPLMAVFLLSFKQRINANWPAPFYISLCILLACWNQGLYGPGCGENYFKDMKKLLKPGVFLGAALVLLLYALPFFISSTPIFGTSLDPTTRLRGWKVLAMKADDIFNSMPRRDKTFIVARRRQTVSELAFYMDGNPRVYRWNGMERDITTQYELWPGPYDKRGWDAMIIIDADKDLKGLDKCFEGLVFLTEIDIDLGHGNIRRFKVFRGIKMTHWPKGHYQ